MEFFDIIILVIIACFALAGLWFGLIHTIGSLLGTVCSFYLAIRYYEPVASWIISITGWETNVARVVIFILAFMLIARIVGITFWLAEKFLHIVTFLPLVTTFNRVLGFVFGAFEGFVVIGVAIYFIERFPLSLSFMEGLSHSQIAPIASATGAILWALAPDAMRLLRSTVDYVEDAVL